MYSTCTGLSASLNVSIRSAGSDKKQPLLQPTVALCTAQTWTETPTVGSLPVVGSKTTPREKTNNTVKARPERSNAQTTSDVCSSTEGKVPALEAIKDGEGIQSVTSL